jgi:hypothetical protein
MIPVLSPDILLQETKRTDAKSVMKLFFIGFDLLLSSNILNYFLLIAKQK